MLYKVVLRCVFAGLLLYQPVMDILFVQNKSEHQRLCIQSFMKCRYKEGNIDKLEIKEPKHLF